jgi:hypothetical protein
LVDLPSRAATPAAIRIASPTIDFAPNLPLILINTTNSLNGDIKVPCVVRVTIPGSPLPDLTNRTDATPALIRYHGATSQMYPKKSFALTLQKPAQLLDLRTNANWVLNATFIDRSLMRHKLSYDLFRSLSTSNAPRHAVASRFVEVYVNGRYRGVYLLMERVDRDLLGLTPWRSNNTHHSCIYKAEDHAANFSQPGHGGYEQREPDPASRGEYWKPMDELNEFISRSPQQEFLHPTTGISSRIDLANAIDFYLLVLFTCNIDGITKNFLIARDAPSDARPQPRFAFVPWDYDGTFGRDWNAARVNDPRWLSNHLFDRLLSHPLYRQQMLTRWQTLRAGPFATATVHAAIDANARTLGEAAQRNARRWVSASNYYPDEASFEEDLAIMKRWVQERGEWLDAELQRRADRAR